MQYYIVPCTLQCYFLQTMQFVGSCLGYIIYATRTLSTSLIVSVNLMDFIYAGDDIERVGLSIIFFILHPVDL